MEKNSFISTIFQKGRNRNIFIFVCVIVLTAITVKVSYAYLFSVKTETIVETVTNGNLTISYIDNSSAITKRTLDRMADIDGLKQTASNVVHIQNTGDVNSFFTINVGYNTEAFKSRMEYSVNDRLVPLDYVMLAVYEYVDGEDKLVTGPISISELPIYKYDTINYLDNRYSLMFGEVGSTSSSKAARTYKVKSWLSNKAPSAINNTFFYVNLEVVDESYRNEVSYNLTGTIRNDEMPLDNAIIEFHNGSMTTKSNYNGVWSLNNIYPGTYNIDIMYEDGIYSGNITIEKSESVNEAIVLSMGNITTKGNLWDLSYNYGTTINKLITKNNINDYSSNIVARTFELMPTYKIVVGKNSRVNNIIIKLNAEDYTFSLSNS